MRYSIIPSFPLPCSSMTLATCSYILIALTIAMNLSAAELKPLNKLDTAELDERLQEDARTALIYRDGLRQVIGYVDSRKDLFPIETPKDSRLLLREEKEVVWNTWQRFLDYMLALESLEQSHARFHRLKDASRENSFLIGYTAMLARYRAALEFIDRVEHNPELDKVLNDAVPEIGLPKGSYAKLKFKYLNVAIATEFAAREILMKAFPGETQSALRAAIQADADYIWKAGRGRAHSLTAKNALKIVQNGASSAWLPIQQGVSEWMGHTKVYRRNECLISPKQINELQPKLMPGDVLLERREWYLSNIGLPGFWSHAALYIGTPEERRLFFEDADTRHWVKQQGESSGDLEALLESGVQSRKSNVGGLASCEAPQEEGHHVRIIEAIGEGVSFKSLEHSAACDALVVLRPRLSKAEKARALLRAFRYVGRPYDFNFDFSTDSELVCTELVYKAYEPATGFTGLRFPTIEMLGRKVTPANELVKQFDVQHGTGDQQFDMIIFLDGQERHKKAVEASLAELRESWKRPKWHVFVQE